METFQIPVYIAIIMHGILRDFLQLFLLILSQISLYLKHVVPSLRSEVASSDEVNLNVIEVFIFVYFDIEWLYLSHNY